jgi:hypothetical protein
LCSKPTKFAMLAAVCLSCNSAAAHQPMPVWNIQITRAKAEEDLQTYRQEIASIDRLIANVKEMIARPETDDCYDVKRSLNLPAEECVTEKQEAISVDESKRAADIAVIDRGIDVFISEYLHAEAGDREYLRTHWTGFADQDILDCELGPVIGSYTALKICLVDWHGNK